jgi:large subunit ribosomal protein L32e
MAEDKKKASKKTTDKKAAADQKALKAKKVGQQSEAVEAKVAETKATKPEATKEAAKKIKGARKESTAAAAPTVKPRPLPRAVEPSTLDLDPETKRLLAARKTNKASHPHFNRIDSHKKDCLDPSWRRPRGHHAQKRSHRKAKGANVKIGYGSPAAINGYHPSGYQEVLVHRVEDIVGITKVQAIRIGGTVGKRKQMAIEKLAKEQNIKVLNPLNTFEGAQ